MRACARSRAARGLPAGATDVELEMIAQTWSEHCKHKIFNAVIRYTEAGREERIDSLFRTYIRATTEAVAKEAEVPPLGLSRQLGRDRLRPGNPGLLQGGDAQLPVGAGSLRRGHHGHRRRQPRHHGHRARRAPHLQHERPVLCVTRHPAVRGPRGASCIRGGSWKECTAGIVDGGNQSGIPVAAGAFLFDESYLGKPLVFCGTGGVLPAKNPGTRRLRRRRCARATWPS